MNARKRDRQIAGQVGDLVETGVGEVLSAAGVPGAGLVALARRTWIERRKKRVANLLQDLLAGETPMDEDEVQKILEEDEFSVEILLKLLEDEEDEKVRVYAALFRAFADGLVAPPLRLRFVRASRELTYDDLRFLATLRQPGLSLYEPTGPHVLLRITFEGSHRVWKLFPEHLLEERPNLVDVFCRYGLVRRVHDRAASRKLELGMVVGHTGEAVPLPGRFRLQIEPELAAYLFVVDARAMGDGLQLRKPTEMSASQVGSIEARDFRRSIVLTLDEHGNVTRTETSRQSFEGPVPEPPRPGGGVVK